LGTREVITTDTPLTIASLMAACMGVFTLPHPRPWFLPLAGKEKPSRRVEMQKPG